MELLHQNSLEDDVIVTSDGTAAVMSSQALKLKKKSKTFVTLAQHQWDMVYQHQLVHVLLLTIFKI